MIKRKMTANHSKNGQICPVFGIVKRKMAALPFQKRYLNFRFLDPHCSMCSPDFCVPPELEEPASQRQKMTEPRPSILIASAKQMKENFWNFGKSYPYFSIKVTI
jgi:hypothetical protein